jgi:hypothetical protein
VGADGDDDSGANSGSAYIFARNGDNWTEMAKLIAGSEGGPGDGFGRSVSISGNYVIVGAYGDDAKGANSGSAYIFVRSGNDWKTVDKLLATDGAAGDYFGQSVSISGDYAIVGARFDDDNGYNSGSAYIFVRNGGNWTEIAKLTASDGAAGDNFGFSVSISGDYVIVGAYGWYYTAGTAYIFEKPSGGWTDMTETAKLSRSGGIIGGYFGVSVSISGDYAIVGAPWDYGSVSSSGSAYIFMRSGGNWTEIAELAASDGASGDQFGQSVSICGGSAIIGANWDDNSSGSAYIFMLSRHSGNWNEMAKLTASDGTVGDNFGQSVSICGDDSIVGAALDAHSGTISGSAYLFKKSTIANIGFTPAIQLLLMLGN